LSTYSLFIGFITVRQVLHSNGPMDGCVIYTISSCQLAATFQAAKRRCCWLWWVMERVLQQKSAESAPRTDRTHARAQLAQRITKERRPHTL